MKDTLKVILILKHIELEVYKGELQVWLANLYDLSFPGAFPEGILSISL